MSKERSECQHNEIVTSGNGTRTCAICGLIDPPSEQGEVTAEDYLNKRYKFNEEYTIKGMDEAKVYFTPRNLSYLLEDFASIKLNSLETINIDLRLEIKNLKEENSKMVKFSILENLVTKHKSQLQSLQQNQRGKMERLSGWIGNNCVWSEHFKCWFYGETDIHYSISQLLDLFDKQDKP